MPKDKKKTKKKPVKSAEKRIVQLEKKLGEMGEQLGKTNEYLKSADIMAKTITSSPELTKHFKQTLNKTIPDKQPQQDNATDNPVDEPNQQNAGLVKKIDSVEVTQRESVVKSFEDRFGISKMKPEEAKEARGKITTFLNGFGWSINTMPMPSLSKNLERAFIGTHAEKLREEGKLEGLVEGRQNSLGVMPTVSGDDIPTNSDGKLDTEQKKWAEKLGVDEDKAAKRYADRDNEKTRKIPAEEKKK